MDLTQFIVYRVYISRQLTSIPYMVEFLSSRTIARGETVPDTFSYPRAFLAPIVLMTCLAGCVTVACDPDDPTFGKDCYECTREATIEAEHTQDGRSRIMEQTEHCLRERGYTKKK